MAQLTSWNMSQERLWMCCLWMCSLIQLAMAMGSDVTQIRLPRAALLAESVAETIFLRRGCECGKNNE